MQGSCFHRYVNSMRKDVDNAIAAIIEDYPWSLPVLKEAVSYSLFGGKRLRSIILLSAYNDLGGSGPDAMRFAAAIEMIHAYSLVHDDLPCMDNDDYRRGKPTCHKKFGEAVALLCGDALFTMAFETMLSCKAISTELAVRAAHEVAVAAGPRGMVGGQVMDLLLEGKTEQHLEVSKMYKMKTGALFEVSAKVGAILAGAHCRIIDAAAQWGRLFGYAYQIIDDIEDSGQGGKEDSKDTLVKEMSLKHACEEARDALEKSIQASSTPGFDCAFMRCLSEMYSRKLGSLA
jgi:geranylgeranyl diphosphate synthase type II